MNTLVLKEKRLKSQKGFTLVEMTIVMIVIALLIAGVVVMGKKMMDNADVSTLNSAILQVQKGVKSLRTARGLYGTGSLNGTLIAEKIIEGAPGFTVSGTTIFHNFDEDGNGTVNVTGFGRRFLISVNRLPAEVCAKVVKANAPSYFRVWVQNSQPTNLNAGGYTADQIKNDPNLPVTMCSGTTNNVHMAFR